MATLSLQLPTNLERLEIYKADIVAFINHGQWWRRLPAEVETSFQISDIPRRRKRFMIMGLIALLIYCGFGFVDQHIIPDVHATAWKIRLGIIAPPTLLLIGLMAIKRLSFLLDFFAILATTICFCGVVILMCISNSPHISTYYTGLILILMFGNIVSRFRFVYAVAYTVISISIYVYALRYMDAVPLFTKLNSPIILSTAASISLIGNFQIYFESKREYLHMLLDKIHTQELELINDKLNYLSVTDDLTGLANRRHFDKVFQQEWNRALRFKHPISLIFIDIDHFKAYNDNYGHPAGDICLQKIGKFLKHHSRRAVDLTARYGGEEFVCLLPGSDIVQTEVFAESLRQSMLELQIEHRYSGTEGFVTFSIGASGIVPDTKTSPDVLWKAADKALYLAKQNGRNRVCVEHL